MLIPMASWLRSGMYLSQTESELPNPNAREAIELATVYYVNMSDILRLSRHLICAAYASVQVAPAPQLFAPTTSCPTLHSPAQQRSASGAQLCSGRVRLRQDPAPKLD